MIKKIASTIQLLYFISYLVQSRKGRKPDKTAAIYPLVMVFPLYVFFLISLIGYVLNIDVFKMAKSNTRAIIYSIAISMVALSFYAIYKLCVSRDRYKQFPEKFGFSNLEEAGHYRFLLLYHYIFTIFTIVGIGFFAVNR